MEECQTDFRAQETLQNKEMQISPPTVWMNYFNQIDNVLITVDKMQLLRVGSQQSWVHYNLHDYLTSHNLYVMT